ncbi:MAG: methyltransferase domain-containing protein [Nanoarchaeota archaeon]|nr:methyltransferase domain-containing protein [Nanoarchaeota archaeon]
MPAWGYFPIEKGFKDFIFKLVGHPHPNGRVRACYVRKFIDAKKKILDIGCGEGIFYYELTKRGYSIVGIEYSKDAIDNMARKLKGVGVYPKVINADAQKLPIKSNSFDQIICLDVIEHLKDANASIKEMSRVLKKNGALILSVPNELYLTKPILPINFKDHLRAIGHETDGFNYNELKNMLESNGFRIVKYNYYTKLFGRLMTELTFWAIGAKNIWKARTKMYDYSYKAFLAFVLTYPIILLDNLLPNKNGGFLIVKAVKLE